MYRYPVNIKTLINAEKIISSTEDMHYGEINLETIYDNKLYKIEWVCGRIRSCYVYDLEGNLLDNYN